MFTIINYIKGDLDLISAVYTYIVIRFVCVLQDIKDSQFSTVLASVFFRRLGTIAWVIKI